MSENGHIVLIELTSRCPYKLFDFFKDLVGGEKADFNNFVTLDSVLSERSAKASVDDLEGWNFDWLATVCASGHVRKISGSWIKLNAHQ